MITVDPRPEVPWKGWTWCRVCGERTMETERRHGDEARCLKHRDRNPCAIEGCGRSTKAGPNWRGLDLWLCSEHWRLIRPRSSERRVYLRIFRTARRFGWNAELRARYWRVWPRLVARARARAADDIDEAEIKRLFGWGKAA